MHRPPSWHAEACYAAPSILQAHNDRPSKPRYTLGKPLTLLDEGSFFLGGQKIHTDFPSTNPVDLNAPAPTP